MPSQEYLVRGVGRLGGIDAIAAVNVKTTNAAPVLVRDIGMVREGAAIKRGEGSHNAKPAVIVGTQKQPAVNTLELTERIDATLDDRYHGPQRTTNRTAWFTANGRRGPSDGRGVDETLRALVRALARQAAREIFERTSHPSADDSAVHEAPR
ncbi:MAG: efflux RND transporter permease subunit [Vicinamibacterales bacterium]